MKLSKSFNCTLMLILLAFWGCGEEIPTAQENRKLSNKELIGEYELVDNDCTGKMVIKEDGTYKETIWAKGKKEPIYSGDWKKWEKTSDLPTQTTPWAIQGDAAYWEYEMVFYDSYVVWAKKVQPGASEAQIRLIYGSDDLWIVRWKKKK